MQSNTLRSLFPPQKPIPRKNFIKENVRHIKEIQGVLQVANQKLGNRNDKFKCSPPTGTPVYLQRNKSGPIRQRNSSNRSLRKSKSKAERSKLQINQLKDLEINNDKFEVPLNDEKKTSRSVQTERTQNVKEIYESGIIKYPSVNVLKEIKQKRMANAHGDSISDSKDECKIENEFQNLTVNGEKDFIKSNIMQLNKKKTNKVEMDAEAYKFPANYKKGDVPKYLKDEKQKTIEEVDKDCPPGHVLLPDEERKETLRVLRQSYADRIQELNLMPVRSDTLRMRRRKMEIEEELKKIDEGIKVFQRPKVFVKINA